jgi:acyl carrier protein
MDIEAKVKQIVAKKLGVPESQVVPSANSIMTYELIPSYTVELVMAFEEEFDLTIPEEDQ